MANKVMQILAVGRHGIVTVFQLKKRNMYSKNEDYTRPDDKTVDDSIAGYSWISSAFFIIVSCRKDNTTTFVADFFFSVHLFVVYQ